LAKIKGPILGLDAKGTIGDAITFTSSKGVAYVRVNRSRKVTRSPIQRAMRALTKFQSKDFSSLSEDNRQSWSSLAKKTNITLLNAQLQDSQNRAKRNLGWRINPTLPGPEPILRPEDLSANGLFKAIDLTWINNPIFPGDYSTAIYLKTDANITATFNQLVIIVSITQLKTLITNLENGQLYRIRMRHVGKGGQLGLLSNVITAMPTA